MGLRAMGDMAVGGRVEIGLMRTCELEGAVVPTDLRSRRRYTTDIEMREMDRSW